MNPKVISETKMIFFPAVKKQHISVVGVTELHKVFK